MPKPEKMEKVAELRAKFEQRSTIIITEYRGLTVEDMANLRSELRKRQVEYRVLKNTLTRLAIEGTDLEGLTPLLEGPVAVAFVDSEAQAAAKALLDFARANQNLKLKGGILSGRVMDAVQLRALATLPPKEFLQARLAGSLKAPIARLHGVLSGPARGLVYALKAIAEQKEQAA
jgi:large subunit ribosomal protein L10